MHSMWLGMMILFGVTVFTTPANSENAVPKVLKGGFRSFKTPLPNNKQEWQKRK